MPTSSKTPILVALAFDPELPNLIDTAVDLARRLDRPLRLIHALDEIVTDPVPLPGFPYLPQAAHDRTTASLRERQQRLAALVQEVQRHVPQTTGQVVPGDAAQVALADANHRSAALVVVGVRDGGYDYVPRGFSTALSLMAEAPAPVLAVSSERRLRLGKPGFKILVSDDLEPGSLAAVRSAYRLAGMLEGAVLHHVHVHGDFRELLRDSWAEVVANAPGLAGRASSPEQLWEERQAERRAQLEQRAGHLRDEALARGAKITFEARLSNKVEQELALVDEEQKPDLVVFGRHQVLKSRPFLLGRMPFRAMTRLERAILVVPGDARQTVFA